MPSYKYVRSLLQPPAARCRARPFRRLLPALLLAAACGDSNGLQDAIFANAVDTVTLGALVGTPIAVPSAFSVTERRAVRSDQTSAFDFAFNIDADGQLVFLPLSVLGLGSNTTADPGLRVSTLAFADIVQAPSSGYVTQDTVPFTVGDRFVVRSRITCGLLGVPQYGKLEVLSLDETERTVSLQVLTNNNCGYKDLTPGIPED
jgi:hypothetical protein